LLPGLFFPTVLLPFVTFAVLYAWPFLEARFTGDHGAHNILDRPRERPVRTAIGVGAIAFYGVLLIAGSDDILALVTDTSIVTVVWVFRVLVLALPPIAGWVTWRILKRGAPIRS